MENALLLILSIIGLLALYWVLFGQWKHNQMMREALLKQAENETKPSDKAK